MQRSVSCQFRARGILWGLGAGLLVAVPAIAQPMTSQAGGQERADAAMQMIVLGVEQAISSLPPTSGQSFQYEFDPSLSTYVASERLGPTVFRDANTIGKGRFGIRVSASYLELSDSLGPIPYLQSVDDSPIRVVSLGLTANAKVGVIDLSATYGLFDRLELSVNLPVVVVDASAGQIFSTPRGMNSDLLAGARVVDGNVQGAVADLSTRLGPAGDLALRERSFGALGFGFNEGTHAGLGRISVGAKALLYSDDRLGLAFAPEFFVPSPSQEQFAGSFSSAILPRFVAALRIADPFRLHLDAGYNYDFEVDELRQFVWNFGASVPLDWATFDLGVGGSKFNRGIAWTPAVASFTSIDGEPGTLRALGNNTLGDNYVNALLGAKVRLSPDIVLSGSVSVPVNNQGFRPDAVGTLAAEWYF